VLLACHHDMVQAFPADRADQTLHICVLSRCDAHLPDRLPDLSRYPGAAPTWPRLPAPVPARCQRTTVSGRTMASASRVFGNSWQTQPRTILSTANNGTRLGLPRRSTIICCRSTRISASTAARGRNRSIISATISLQRSNIPQRIIRFCVSRQPDGIYDRDNQSRKTIRSFIESRTRRKRSSAPPRNTD
jgi:hypothetical protein